MEVLVKVYIAFSGDYEDRGVVGVFASEQAAEAALRQDPAWKKREAERLGVLARNERTVSGAPMRWAEKPYYDVEEWDVTEA